jgi:hypothetical protein
VDLALKRRKTETLNRNAKGHLITENLHILIEVPVPLYAL